MRFTREVEIFVAVVDSGSFTAAAARLDTAKSSISDAVRSLEDRVGVRLLDRTTRHLRLTEGGRAFLARCRGVLEEFDRAEDEARAWQAAPTGHIRVAVPEAFSHTLIVPCLNRLMGDEGALRIELRSDRRSVSLLAERFDLAIRIASEIPSPLIARLLGVQRMIVVASPAYLIRHGTPGSIDELAGHRVIGTTPPLPGHDGLSVKGRTVTMDAPLVTNSAAALRAAALEGLGIVAVPDWLVRDALDEGGLRRVLDGVDAAVRGIYAVHSPHRLLSPAAASFVDAVEAELRCRGVPTE